MFIGDVKLRALQQCRLIFSGSLLIALPAVTLAQQTPETTLLASARLVVLDVSVQDTKGHPVIDLDQSQFVITEGKTVETVRYFEAPAQHMLPAGQMIVRSSADLKKIGDAPVTLLVLDELNTPFADRAYAQTRMIRYLEKQPTVMPSPTLLVAAGDAHFVVLHDYTQSRDELLDKVRHHFPDYPWTMMRQDAGDQMTRTLGALDQIADSSRGTPGRKNVIWVGMGYPSIDETGMAERDAKKLSDAIELVTRRLMEARVTLYTIDPGGPKVTPPAQVISGSGDSASGTGPALGPFDPSSVDFSQLALVTGGRVLFARNDVDHEIAEEIGEGNSYYTISYVPQSQSDAAAAYRQIHVTMKDPTLHAVTRDGYFPAPRPVEKVEMSDTVKQPKQLSFDLMSAAQSNLVYNGLSVIATRSSSGFDIKVGAQGMKWTPQENGDRLAVVTVLGVAYSAKGKPLNERAAQLTEIIRPDAGIDKNTWVTLSFSFSTPPGTARVRLVVRDAGTGAIGTADPKP
jgi:VWFA-related protein